MNERVFSAVQESVTLTHALLRPIVLGAVLVWYGVEFRTMEKLSL